MTTCSRIQQGQQIPFSEKLYLKENREWDGLAAYITPVASQRLSQVFFLPGTLLKNS